MCSHDLTRIKKAQDLSTARMLTVECTKCGKRRMEVKHLDGATFDGDWYQPKETYDKKLLYDESST